MKPMTTTFYMFLVPCCIAGLLIFLFSRGDAINSPNINTAKPLAFTILTDNKTGCDYLETAKGITPRLNPNGTQVCDRRAASTENLSITEARQ